MNKRWYKYKINLVLNLLLVVNTKQFIMALLIFLLTLVPFALAENAPCVINGTEYQAGDNFTTTSSGKCIIYQCDEHGGYAPILIECLHSDNNCYGINTEKNENCVTKRCENRNNSIAFYTTSERCNHNGVCLEVGEFIKESCIKRTCTYVNDTYNISFEYECIDGADCKALAYVRTSNNGCTKEICDTRAEGTGFYLQSHECPFNGTCVAQGNSVPDGCRQRQCQVNGNAISLVQIKNGCPDSGSSTGCSDINHVRDGVNKCIKETCEERNGLTGFYTTTTDCLHNGECVTMGDWSVDSCVNRTCVLEAGYIKMKPSDVQQCQNGDLTCSPIGTLRNASVSGCVTEKCDIQNGSIGYFHDLERCDYNKECVNKGDTRMEGCFTRQCQQDGNFLIMNYISIECDNNGTCEPQGHTRMKNCVNQTCVYDNLGVGYRNTIIGCKDNNGTCHNEGDVISGGGCFKLKCQVSADNSSGFILLTIDSCMHENECIAIGSEVTTSNCITMQCKSTGGFSNVKYQCKDSNNVCQDLGDIKSFGSGGCTKQNCSIENNSIGYRTIAEECFDGTVCQPVGYVKQDAGSCISQTCTLNGTTIGFITNTAQCTDTDGTCRALGYTKNYAGGCIVQICSNINNNIYFATTKAECSYNGNCVKQNVTVVDDCATKTCTLTGNKLLMKTTVLKCLASDGSCKTPVIDVFSYRFDDGTVKPNCVCTADLTDNSRKYTCS